MKSTVNKPKTLDEYLDLSYAVTLYPEVEGGFTAEIKDLPGCISQGETVEEAYAMINDAREGWLTVAFENGLDIPLPAAPVQETHSGKFVLRVPKALHRQLSERAELDGSSLNSYVVALLAQQLALASVMDVMQEIHHDISQVRRELHRDSEMRVRVTSLPLDPRLSAYQLDPYGTN